MKRSPNTTENSLWAACQKGGGLRHVVSTRPRRVGVQDETTCALRPAADIGRSPGRPEAAINVTAFIDWNTQMHNAHTLALEPLDRARKTLAKTTEVVGRALARRSSSRFRVSFRLYHGWHKGWQETDNLRAVITAVAEWGSPAWRNAAFAGGVEYGHTLYSALPRRLTAKSIHLPGTLRQQARNLAPVEKMVDTALATDRVYWAFSGNEGWALVVSDDDDVIPPVLTAEATTFGTRRRVFILKTPRWNSNLIDLSDLLLEAR